MISSAPRSGSRRALPVRPSRSAWPGTRRLSRSSPSPLWRVGRRQLCRRYASASAGSSVDTVQRRTRRLFVFFRFATGFAIFPLESKSLRTFQQILLASPWFSLGCCDVQLRRPRLAVWLPGVARIFEARLRFSLFEESVVVEQPNRNMRLRRRSAPRSRSPALWSAPFLCPRTRSKVSNLSLGRLPRSQR
jgi:hypothetical protein